MESPRAEKVAVVDEVRERFSSSDGVLLTEYRGIDVSAMAELRRALSQAGGEYKVYKNTLVRLAVRDLGLELDELLVGPTALAFVPRGDDGRSGDAARVAKALKEFARTNEALVVKGGILGDKVLTADDARVLADLPSREQLFAEFAGSMEYLLSEFAGLLDAKLRELSYAMQELLDKGTLTPGEAAPAAEAAPEPADDATGTEPADDEPADDEPAADAAPSETDQDDDDQTDTPAAEADDASATEES